MIDKWLIHLAGKPSRGALFYALFICNCQSLFMTAHEGMPHLKRFIAEFLAQEEITTCLGSVPASNVPHDMTKSEQKNLYS